MKNLILTVGTLAIAACNIVGCAGDIGDESPEFDSLGQDATLVKLLHADNRHLLTAQVASLTPAYQAAISATESMLVSGGPSASAITDVAHVAPTDARRDILWSDGTSNTITCVDSGQLPHAKRNQCRVTINTVGLHTKCAGNIGEPIALAHLAAAYAYNATGLAFTAGCSIESVMGATNPECTCQNLIDMGHLKTSQVKVSEYSEWQSVNAPDRDAAEL